MRGVVLFAVAGLGACSYLADGHENGHGHASGPHAHAHAHSAGAVAPGGARAGGGRSLPPGSNEMLRSPIAAAPGLEVIVSDVIIPPNASVPWHYHPGEEFVYVIEGSAIHREAGRADIVLKAGDTYAIRPQARHSPVGGPDGARAIVFRVHVAGKPERILDGK